MVSIDGTHSSTGPSVSRLYLCCRPVVLILLLLARSRYPARITSISGPPESTTYTLIFQGYTTPITLPAACLRPLSTLPTELPTNTSSAPAAASNPITSTSTPSSATITSSSAPKRKPSQAETKLLDDKRKKKNEKWAEKQQEKTKEVLGKKDAWESFGKKAKRKGVKIGG
jgi:hypothetical protein